MLSQRSPETPNINWYSKKTTLFSPDMSRLPKRHGLPSQAAGIIEEMITTGELQNFIPGERTLAERLQIGRDTLRASLQILEQKRVISEPQHGRRRSILNQSPSPTRTSSKRVGFLSPKKLLQLPPQLLAEFDTLRELLQKQFYELELVSPGIFHLQNPFAKLEKPDQGPRSRRLDALPMQSQDTGMVSQKKNPHPRPGFQPRLRRSPLHRR